ncbi:MAG: aldo/keto reductase [Chloroflexota bacterium]
MKSYFSRRKFIKSTLSAGAVIAGSRLAYPGTPESEKARKVKYDAKGLPTVKLGKTGVEIPRMAIGLGSRFLNIATLDEALAMCNFALDNGLYYWDTAHTYVNSATGAVSEERIGHIVKDRRDEIFLSTKVAERDPAKVRAQVELSLRRLQTDHLDMLKIHAVESPDDVNQITKAGGVLDILTKLKEEGVTRFIGFSGHGNSQALKAMVDTGRFDSMLFAMNHYVEGSNKFDRQGEIIPAAKSRGMGIMVMKTVRPKETIKDLDPRDLVRYALSLDGPSGVIVGMDSRKVVESNLDLLRNFKPMDSAEKQKYAMLLSPYYRHENLAWMKPGYRDGIWV